MSDIQTRDIEEAPGIISMMRVALKETIGIAKWMLLVVAGMFSAMMATGHYELATVAWVLAAGIPTVVGTVSIAKAIQSGSEQPIYQTGAPVQGRPGTYNP